MNRPTCGFTLIEVVVVMSIITILLGMGIPGVINAQRRADRYATVNIIQTVHDACVSNAKQFGGAGAVYGFTLAYGTKSTSYVPSSYAALSIKPWVIIPDGSNTVVYNTTAGYSLQADIGKEMMWTGDLIEFVDTTLPAGRFVIQEMMKAPNVTDVSSTAGQSIHVAYEPRTGFVFADKTSISNLVAASITIPGGSKNPARVELTIWRKGANGTATNTILLQPTGACDVRLPQ